MGLVVGQAAHAQPAGPRDVRAQIEASRLDLGQIDAALQRESLDDKRLGDLRARLQPIDDAIAEIVAREQPRADDIKARLDQLGPVPDASKGQQDSPEVAKERMEQQKQWKDADETLRLAKASALRVEQIAQAIAERRRQNFTRQILAQHASIVSPWLWLDVTKSLPADTRALHFLSTQWVETIFQNLDWYEALVLVLLALSAVVLAPRARQWVLSGTLSQAVKDVAEEQPELSRLSKVMLALRMLLLHAVVPALGLRLIYMLLDRFDLLPGRAEAVLEALLTSLAFFAFMNGLSSAVFAPGRQQWRLFAIENDKALEIWRLIRAVTLVVVLGRCVESIHAAIVASLPLTNLTKGLFSVAVALLIARGLRRIFGGPSAAHPETHGGLSDLPLRLAAWLAVIAILGAALIGFVPLASFLVSQVVWLSILGMLAVLALVLIEEVIGAGLSATGLLGRRVRAATGLNASSLDQFSVLGAGLVRLLLFIALGMVALAPWGVDSANFGNNLKAAFFGFQVGGVTISLSTLAVAIVLFLVGFFITRAIQNWLDTRYLPHTRLDPGLRNSIRTIFGYVGIVLAAIVALSQLGFSLDKLTIVAGALSVGIGFGLQSIVNNFVSGLILLWERPIRVGDWIVVGDEQGMVKHINVRATEIETFDRASLIIPNAEFISGRVKNWMHADRTGRVIIPVNIDYMAEPEQVQEVLLAAANAHREVFSEPKPMVIFKNLGESGLDFELRCFCDVGSMATTRSELLFDIFKRLRDANISIPYPTRRLEITNFPPMVAPPPVVEPDPKP